MNILELKDIHYGEAAFCLGTAPHLNKLNLNLLKDFVTIGCNQLADFADKYYLDYICFQRDERFRQVKEKLDKTVHPKFIIPDNILSKNVNWQVSEKLKGRIYPCHIRFTSPGHAEFFSFDLENCFYAGDSVGIEIQLAVWMGCNPIYVLGVDAEFSDPEQPFFDDSYESLEDRERSEKYIFSDIKQLLGKIKGLLWSKGIRLFNAAGKYSSLDVLPRVRLEAAVKKPSIAVTSKTFSKDKYLVKELKRYCPNVKINTSSTKLKGGKLIEFLKDADGIILGTESFDANVMKALPCLRFVSKYGVGINNIDFEAAKRNEIEISYKKGVNSDSVAELTLAFALMLCREIDRSMNGYRSGKWKKLAGRELAEMTLGIVGYGNVGKVVAQKFAAVGIGRLLVNDLISFQNNPPLEFVPLDYLLQESDIVSIHVSMERQNHHMVNEEFVSKMRKGAFLINTSRGEVVDEKALVKVLKNGYLGGAAMDVYEDEPNINKSLLSHSNLLTTCHIAGSSNRAIKNMGWTAIEGLLKLFNMSPY